MSCPSTRPFTCRINYWNQSWETCITYWVSTLL